MCYRISSSYYAGEELRETRCTSSTKKVGQFHPSAQNIMGKQVANNKEAQMILSLRHDKGKWYILSEPKSPGLVKKEYLPIGNRLVYPKKWGREKAVEVFLNYLIKDNELIKGLAEERLEYLYKLKEENHIGSN